MDAVLFYGFCIELEELNRLKDYFILFFSLVLILKLKGKMNLYSLQLTEIVWRKCVTSLLVVHELTEVADVVVSQARSAFILYFCNK